MSNQLIKHPFSPDLLPLVKDFDCRENRDRPAEPWESEVNEWIVMEDAAKEGARYRMTKKGGKCKVWLYLKARESGEGYDVVGYGSLSPSKWPDPSDESGNPDLPKVPVSLIPSVGIQTAFQGGPAGATKEEKYSRQILDHLVLEARNNMTSRQPFLFLYVHPKNVRAIALYDHYGFKHFSQTWTHPTTRTVYLSMYLALSYFRRGKSDESPRR